MPNFLIRKIALPAALFISATAALPATAQDNSPATPQNHIKFDVVVTQTVQNDTATARITKSATAATARELAQKTNTATARALAILKHYPDIKVQTDSQRAHPNYDDKGKMIGFQGAASLTLTATDIEQLAQAIGELQTILVPDSLDFSVSDDKKAQTNNQLLAIATQNFKAKAAQIATLWGAKNYKLIEAVISDDVNSYPYRAVPATMYSKATVDSAPIPEFAAGDSTVRYSISGTIELIY